MDAVAGRLRSCIREGHFELSSGKHSDVYIQTAPLFEDSNTSYDLAWTLSRAFANSVPVNRVSTVIGLANGATLLGYEMARQEHKRYLFMEKGQLLRGQDIQDGEHVLIVEDVITTGATVFKAFQEITQYGGVVEGVVSLVNRGADDFVSVPVISLIDVVAKTYEPDDGPCPLCMQGIPIETYEERKRGVIA
jgi:orotate phosphoribosyltransferase